MEDELIAYSVKTMKEMKFMDGGDAAKMGAGVMTDARWKQTYDLMVSSGQLKPNPNWQQAYTLQFLKDLKK